MKWGRYSGLVWLAAHTESLLSLEDPPSSYQGKGNYPVIIHVSLTHRDSPRCLQADLHVVLSPCSVFTDPGRGIRGRYQEPTKQPITTRYLSHVTGYQPIRDK